MPLTANEVNHARTYPQVALAIVSGISVEIDAEAQPVATGGELALWNPWDYADQTRVLLSRKGGSVALTALFRRERR